jgi:hypothetical protein
VALVLIFGNIIRASLSVLHPSQRHKPDAPSKRDPGERRPPNSTVWQFDSTSRDCRQKKRNDRKDADARVAKNARTPPVKTAESVNTSAVFFSILNCRLVSLVNLPLAQEIQDYISNGDMNTDSSGVCANAALRPSGDPHAKPGAFQRGRFK